MANAHRWKHLSGDEQRTSLAVLPASPPFWHQRRSNWLGWNGNDCVQSAVRLHNFVSEFGDDEGASRWRRQHFCDKIASSED
jgi:hypothetical protein